MRRVRKMIGRSWLLMEYTSVRSAGKPFAAHLEPLALSGRKIDVTNRGRSFANFRNAAPASR
jgi:hypothetical protein